MAARCSRSGPRCGGRINARTRHAGVPGTGRMTVRGRLGAISGTSSLSAAATRRQWLAGATVPPPGLPTGTLRRPKGLIAVFAQWKIDWHSNCSVATIDLRFVACSASTAMPLRTSLSASRVQAWNVLDVLPVRRSGRCRTHGAAGEASTVQNHQVRSFGARGGRGVRRVGFAPKKAGRRSGIGRLCRSLAHDNLSRDKRRNKRDFGLPSLQGALEGTSATIWAILSVREPVAAGDRKGCLSNCVKREVVWSSTGMLSSVWL